MAVTLTLAYEVNSQNVANNTSNITVTVRAKWTGGSYNLTQKSGYVIIDGTKYTFTSSFNTGRTTSGTGTLYTKTVNVTHGSDGKKTLSCSGSYTTGVSSGTIAAAFSEDLPTIPRKSTLSIGNGTLGTAQTLTVTKQDSSFTHTITFKCGTASGTICTNSSATSISWTPSLGLASQNTTGTSVSITVTIATLSGGTSIGSNTKTITCAIPASVRPSCTVEVTDPTGYTETYGNPIKGLSKFNIVVTPTLAYGSPIDSYSVTANGTKYTSSSFTTDVLRSAGTSTVSTIVTDKRGRKSVQLNVSKTVLDYTEPVVIKMTVRRCDQDGTENIQGNYTVVTFSAAVTSLNNKNTANYVLRYKKSSEAAYDYDNDITLGDLEDVYSVTDATYIFPADSGSSYDVEIEVADNFNSTPRATSVSTAFAIMHFGSDGTSIGIGKLAEEEGLFDVGLNSRFNGTVCGNVLGLNRLPGIPANSELNDYMSTGCWAIYSNAIAATITCGGVLLGTDNTVPPARAGRFEVSSSTGEGIRLEEWSYIRQRFIPYNDANPIWERDITRSSDNVWRYYNWWRSNLTPTISKRVYHEQKVLWGEDLTTGMYMTAGHTATLSEKISEQAEGIELVFCYYNGTSDTNWGWQTFRVSKKIVELEPGGGHTFKLSNGKFGSIGTKYLYINDDRIVGHADNNLTGTSGSGITYANNKFVLRYVLGV